MTALAGAGLFLLQTFIIPLLCGVVMARLAGVARADRAAFVLYGLGLWSAVSALVIDLALRFAPGLPREAYLATYAAIAAVITGAAVLVLSTEPRRISRSDIKNGLRAGWNALSGYARIAIGIVAVIALFFLVQNLSEPLTGNDAIVHTMVARIISRDMSAAAYPLATADPITGFLLEGVHPLGFPASKALFMILLGDIDTPWHKPLAAVYFIYLLLAVGTLSGRLFGSAAAAFSMLIVAGTPLLLHSVATAHIDPLRLHGFFLCFAMLAEFARRGERCWLVLGALAFVEALHSHAGNLMLLGFLGPLFLLAAQGPIWKRILLGAALGLPALVLVSPQFIVNLRTYGSLLGVDYALERLDPAPFLRWVDIQRSLVTLPDIIVNGALAPFTDPGWFASGFWLGLVGIVFVFVWGEHHRRPVQVLIGAVLIYAAIMCLAVVTRYKSFYMNTRYMLVMLPVMAIFGGYLFGRLVRADAAVIRRSGIARLRLRGNSPKVVFIIAGFFILPAFVSLYQVLLPFAQAVAVDFGLASSTDDPALARIIGFGLGTPLLLLALLTWIAVGRWATALIRETLGTEPDAPAGAAKVASLTDRARNLLLFMAQFAAFLPIGLLLLPALIRVYGAAEALGVRALVNAGKGGTRSLTGLFVLCVIILLVLWRWRSGRFPQWLRYPGAYPLLILCGLVALGYAFSLDLILQAWNLAPAAQHLAIATSVVLTCLVTFIIWVATRFVWARRSRGLLPARAGGRRLLGYALARRPTDNGYVTISYLFMPLLLANLYYGLGPLRSLVHPLYMWPSLIFQSDIAKAEATRGRDGGLEYLEPSLQLRDAASAGKAPKTLTFRDAEIFAYGGGTIFSNYDPRIWDLYATRTAEQAYELLRQKGIDHIYMPNYSSPTNNFNGIGELLARRDLIRIARQSGGSVFTLFEVAPQAGRIAADTIYRGELDGPLRLERKAFDIFPKGLGNCAGLRDIHGNIVGWYWSQVVLRLTRVSCLNAYADQNWILLPPAKDGETYRLEADMTAVGCVGLRVMHRIPPDQPGGDYTVASSDFMHFALKPDEKAALWFQRPAGSDAIAVGFYGGCGQPSGISAFHVERLREAAP